MALLVDSCLRKHLKILVSSDGQILVDFCKLALDYIKNGPNHKKYNNAAQKLQTSVDVIENAITGLVKLLIDASKYSISTEDFKETVKQLSFDENQCEILEQFYTAKQESVRNVLSKLGCSFPSYRDLNWRIEAQVASRSVPSHIQSNVVLDLQLDTPNGHLDNNKSNEDDSKDLKDVVQHVPLQCDLPGLIHMTARLETALRESKTFHIRRMQRVLEQ